MTTELSKYDVILEEINSLEKQAAFLARKNRDLVSRVESLENSNRELSLVNAELNSKLLELEGKLESLLKDNDSLRKGNSLNLKERESLKMQINDLISKIDYHLRS